VKNFIDKSNFKTIKSWLPFSEQFWYQLDLLKSLVQRSLTSRYKGSALGNFWPFLDQFAMIAIYTFVFSTILKLESDIAGLPQDTPLAFGAWLYAGLLPWIAFNNGLNQATVSVIQQANLVKKIVFPLFLLPLIPVLTSFIESTFGLAILIVWIALLVQKIQITIFLLPIVWIPQLLFTAGLGYFFSGLSVFLRDIPQTLSLILRMWIFLTPIMYPITLIPEQARFWILWLNPLTVLVGIHRELLLIGTFSHWGQWSVTLAISGLVFIGGVWCYQKLSPAFADVL
jgi:lipopolysaccharide transport system permease protein